MHGRGRTTIVIVNFHCLQKGILPTSTPGLAFWEKHLQNMKLSLHISETQDPWARVPVMFEKPPNNVNADIKHKENHWHLDLSRSKSLGRDNKVELGMKGHHAPCMPIIDGLCIRQGVMSPLTMPGGTFGG